MLSIGTNVTLCYFSRYLISYVIINFKFFVGLISYTWGSVIAVGDCWTHNSDKFDAHLHNLLLLQTSLKLFTHSFSLTAFCDISQLVERNGCNVCGVNITNKWSSDGRFYRQAVTSAGCCRKYPCHQRTALKRSRNSWITSSTHVTVFCAMSACLTSIMWALVAWRQLRYADVMSFSVVFSVPHWPAHTTWLDSVCLFCVFGVFSLISPVCLVLSVSVQVIAWKGSSLNWPIICRVGRKTVLTHWFSPYPSGCFGQ